MRLKIVKIRTITKNGIKKKNTSTARKTPSISSTISSTPKRAISGRIDPTAQAINSCLPVRFALWRSSKVLSGVWTFAVDLLLNVTRETECANRSMLRSNDFIALAYFFEYPAVLFFLDISSSSLPFIGTPSGTPQPIQQSAPAPSSDHKSAADAPG